MAEVLSASEFDRVVQIKADANKLFGAGENTRALDCWSAALEVYSEAGVHWGSPEQRFEKGKILSNKAEAALKLWCVPLRAAAYARPPIHTAWGAPSPQPMPETKLSPLVVGVCV